MSISGIGSNISSSQVFSTSPLALVANDGDAGDSSSSVTASSSPRKQLRSDFATLLAAVQQGDMTSAQQALTSVQSDLSSAGATYSPSSQPGTAQVPTDLQSLFSAVQQGDSTSAQQALQKLQSDAAQHRAGGAHGHGHHHHHQVQPSDPTSATDTANDVTGNGTPQDRGATSIG